MSFSADFTITPLAGLFKRVPFSDPWGPYTTVQPVRHSLVNHAAIAISAYRQVSLLHLGKVRQRLIGGSTTIQWLTSSLCLLMTFFM